MRAIAPNSTAAPTKNIVAPPNHDDTPPASASSNPTLHEAAARPPKTQAGMAIAPENSACSALMKPLRRMSAPAAMLTRRSPKNWAPKKALCAQGPLATPPNQSTTTVLRLSASAVEATTIISGTVARSARPCARNDHASAREGRVRPLASACSSMVSSMS